MSDTTTIEREEVLLQIRKTLAEHFDCGLCIVSWEDSGTTYDMDLKFGNHHAVKNLVNVAETILWPPVQDDEEEIV